MLCCELLSFVSFSAKICPSKLSLLILILNKFLYTCNRSHQWERKRQKLRITFQSIISNLDTQKTNKTEQQSSVYKAAGMIFQVQRDNRTSIQNKKILSILVRTQKYTFQPRIDSCQKHVRQMDSPSPLILKMLPSNLTMKFKKKKIRGWQSVLKSISAILPFTEFQMVNYHLFHLPKPQWPFLFLQHMQLDHE